MDALWGQRSHYLTSRLTKSLIEMNNNQQWYDKRQSYGGRRHDANSDAWKGYRKSNRDASTDSWHSQGSSRNYGSDSGFSGPGAYKEQKYKKREDSMKEAKKQKRIQKLEGSSRSKFVDKKYNKSDKICMFYPPGKCGHCDGDHFGAPFQSGKITGEDGKLETVPCPVQ